ncbi:oligosaccharide flippase family protein [Ferrovibrio sp.]|uniref:lipopolysaccharide biosynthesis protein n=1 Tax=Ferrovibrio sp. TaxID=1917215 RepID=UPI00311DC10A
MTDRPGESMIRRLESATAPETLAGAPAFIAALRRDYLGYLVSLGLLNLGGLLLLPLATAYLSPAELGLYGLVETAHLQGVTFSLLGLKFAYLYYYAHIPADQRPAMFGTTLLLSGTASLLAGIVLWALFDTAAVMQRFDSAPLPQAWLMLPLMLTGATLTVLLTELRAARQVWLSGAIAILQLAVWLLLSILLVGHLGTGLPGLLLAQAAAGGLACIAAFACIARRLQFRWQPRLQWQLLRYGTPMMAGLVLRYSLDTLSRFLLAAFVSIEAAGIFMICMRVTLLFESLLALPFFMAWGGLVHHALRQSAAAVIVGRVTGIILVSSGLLVLIMLALQPWLFQLLAHAPMPDVAPLFSLLLLARAVQLVKSPLTSGILVTGRTGWSTTNSLLALVVFCLLCYPASRLWEAAGMAAALLVAQSLATAWLVAEAWRHCRPQLDSSSLLCAALGGGGAILALLPGYNPVMVALPLAAALAIALWMWRHSLRTVPDENGLS